MCVGNEFKMSVPSVGGYKGGRCSNPVGAIPWRELHYEYWVLDTTSKETATVQSFLAKSPFQNKEGGSYISKTFLRRCCVVF